MSTLPRRADGPSLISLAVSVDVKHHVYLLTSVLDEMTAGGKEEGEKMTSENFT